MTIQDIVIAGANVLFSLFLLPTILNRSSKVPRLTSLTTGAALVVEAVVFLSLGLILSFATTLASAGLWITIAAYRSFKKPAAVALPPPFPTGPPDDKWLPYWKVVRRTITDLDQRIQGYEVQMYTILAFLAVLAFTLTRLIPSNLYGLALAGIAEGVAVSGIVVSAAILARTLHFVNLLYAAVDTGELVEAELFREAGLSRPSRIALTQNLSINATPAAERLTIILGGVFFMGVFATIFYFAAFRPAWL